MAVPRDTAAFVLTVMFAVAACSAGAGSPEASSASVGGGSASAGAGGVAIGTASSASLGTFLTGPNGLTLYTHAGDGPSLSTCTGGCATAWPPLTLAADAQPAAGAGVTGLLGTFIRADGTTQVTYDGMPLYYWQSDTKPGETTGEGVNGFSVAKASGAAPVQSDSGKPAY